MMLENAICDAVGRAISTASDRFVRAELPPSWPIDTAVRTLTEAGGYDGLRVGLLRPFANMEGLDFDGLTTSSDPAEITAWRNEKGRHDPILVLGRATGEKTAGLQDLAIVVSPTDVVDEWKSQIDANRESLPDKAEVHRLVDSLFERLRKRTLDAVGLNDYLAQLRASRSDKLGKVYDEMWRLSLIPDRQAIDAGKVPSRLGLNSDVVQTLRNIDESGWVEKLREVAKGSGKKADLAKKALKYSETGNPQDLRGIWLENLLSIKGIKKKKTRNNGNTPRSYGLHDLLDLAHENKTKVEVCLLELSDEWKLDNPDLEQIRKSIEIDDEVLDIQIDLEPNVIPVEADDEAHSEHSNQFVHIWTDNESNDDVLIAVSPLAEPVAPGKRDHAIEARSVGVLMKSIEMEGSSELMAAFKSVIRRRHNLRQYEPWLLNNAVELLLIHQAARDAVGLYLRTWREFVNKVTETRPEIAKFVQMMDACWGADIQELEWCILGSLHPYNLDPLHSTAQFIAGELSNERPSERLGEKHAWILERCHPAYPNIYSGETTFHFSASGNDLTYVATSSAQLPRAQTGTGLDSIARSLFGFSPNLKTGMTVCVIDPPPGGAITNQLRKIGGSSPLSVLMAATRADANPLDDEELDVRFLGRFDSLADVDTHARVQSNVLVAFLPYPSATAAARHGWSATRGTFLSPHLEVQRDPLLDDEDAIVAEVLVQPRDHNLVVCAMQDLYQKQTGNLAKHFQFRPVLRRNDELALRSLSAKCDWLVIAVPGPMGLAAPARINSQLHYVGRAGLGPYALYTYACDELFATRKYIEKKLRDSPAQVPVATLTDKLTKLARDSAAAILAMGRSDIQVREHQAALVALKAAQDRLDDEALSIVVSVDDLAWSQIWIGKGTRCDYLIVSLKDADDNQLQCSVIAVESKSYHKSEPIDPRPNLEPYKKGSTQVTQTLDALADVIAPSGDIKLDMDVRYASFVEHLMAAVLSVSSSTELKKLQKYASLLNRMAARDFENTAVSFHGIVVATQANTNAESVSTTRSCDGAAADVTLVRCTARDIDDLFGTSYVDQAGDEDDSGLEDAAPPPDKPDQPSPVATDEPAQEEQGDEPEEVESEDNETPEGEEELAGEYQLDEESERLAHELLVVCQRHSIPIESLKPLRIAVGPTLFAVSVKLQVGAQLNAIERRLEDIMRDLGLGDRAHEVSVENDSEPSAVRFLIPRPDRFFPPLPTAEQPLVSDGSYLPLALGQTVNGEDFCTAIEDWPHMLIAGSSGSGKTTLLRSMLIQLARFPSTALDLVLIDGKGDADYLHILPEGIFSEKYPEPLLGHDSVVEVLEWVVEEMDVRRDRLHEYAKKTKSQVPLKWPEIYKHSVQAGEKPDVVPLIVLIDEFADIMLAGKKSADAFLDLVQRVAQVGRSRLIHLVLATQRPDRNTIKGAIKSNLDARVAMRLPTSADSMTIMGHGGAEKLLKKGDFWFQQGGSIIRLQGYSC